VSLWVQLIGSATLVVSLMFAAGLQLRTSDLLAVRTRPRALALALLVNLVAVPGLAWALLAGLAVPVEITLGLMLCAAAPGGPAAVLYANTAKADLPLTVSLTIVLPILGVVTTPLTLALVPGLPADLRIPAGPIIGSLVGFQLIPLTLGMLIRARRPELAARLAPWAKGCANASLGLLVVAMLILQGHVLFATSARAWTAMLGTGAIALVLGWLGAAPERDSARAGAIVAISRNISVSIMLASTFFVDPVVNATVLTFGLIAFAGPLVLATVWRRSAQPPAPSPAPSPDR
jgi:bile acid:Na+ symporter, BASS family